ncbi:hypothetical protein [Vibrio mediterranei]|uniref:Outer membrane protein beta-barrel domain-containing protein n=1 Tax=Vibrio mediterranei TaxID=689 RepID=A0ABX5DD82_9VIBR|nr:hypothetical protein [Vibrio mediterranei]MCG9660420.1 hypothetical protein [Vibrio mediterranei]MCG9661673.1 hypothetical protein [Vibrio mediterranei]PCD86952.1 hypothetical protein COR52_18730 [Vibrio mediterranei]PRQ66276.1 hypothetical protein COR51_17970 [Vibrio mediterranei]PTC04094.1 hypothetical protein C9980_14205 [Vibrio mediterranei]
MKKHLALVLCVVSSPLLAGTYNSVSVGTTSDGGFGVGLYHDRNLSFGFYSNLAGGTGPNNDDFALNVGLVKSFSENFVGYVGAGIANRSEEQFNGSPIKTYDSSLRFNGNIGLLFKTGVTGFTADVGYNTGLEAAYFGVGYTY